jgi:hypothetical protein
MANEPATNGDDAILNGTSETIPEANPETVVIEEDVPFSWL